MQNYSVGFKIFDGRSLQTEDGLPCDAFCIVECCGNTFQTETLEERSSLAPWNESCIWPSIPLYPKEFESAFLSFSIYARNWFSRNYLIGKASLQLSFINKRRHHLYARQWLSLRRDDGPECTGMLNVTVFMLKPGEQAPSASEQETPADDGNQEEGGGEDMENLTAAVLKTTVEKQPGKPHHVMINVHRVEDLRELGGGQLPNPYVTVEFAGCLVKTIGASAVQQYTFNECAQVPVMTPLYEDTIIVKLWTSNWFSPDELLAQGLISFSELRNKSLPPRWFILYGWDKNEISDVKAISATGVDPEPNFFKGRLLLSGRIERMETEEELTPPQSTLALAIIEPMTMTKLLLADVYMVTGANGRNCQVEMSFGLQATSTQPVAYNTEKAGGELAAPSEDAGGWFGGAVDVDEEGIPATTEMVNTFSFGQEKGRLEPMLVMTPDDAKSQPFLMINVYTDSYVSGMARIGYGKNKIADFAEYEPGVPGKPKFISLQPMPNLANDRHPPAVLVTVEHSSEADVLRHNRKTIKPMVYIVRAYCFMGRNMRYDTMRPDTAEAAYFHLRTSCAGMSQVTKTLQGPRPLWMDHVDLKVILCSDSTKEPPTMEPITVTLVEHGVGGMWNRDIGRAVCVYTHMRKKDSLRKWEKFELAPQWITVYGGGYGNLGVGEVLVAFELLSWKNKLEVKLQPKEMWPQPEELHDKREHFSCLRKATLHFSLHGLRDLPPFARMAGMGTAVISQPQVSVEVFRFDKETETMTEEQLKKNRMFFEFRKVVPGGDERVKVDSLKSWTSECGLYKGANYEFLQVQELQVQIPDKMLLQPFVRIKVFEAGGMFSAASLIGESLQSLHHLLPCCWLEGVDMEKPFNDQVRTIKAALKKERSKAKVQAKFRQLSDEEQAEFLALQKEEENEEEDENKPKVELVVQEESKPEALDSTAIALELRGLLPYKRPIFVTTMDQNRQLEVAFSPRDGEPSKEIGGESARKTVDGKLENSTELPFIHDFWYKNVPLLRNHDIVDKDDNFIDWNFQPGQTFGFVKCCYKLVDGWVEKAEGSDDEGGGGDDDHGDTALGEDDDDSEEEGDEDLLRRSFEFDKDLNKYAFKEKAMTKKFKGPENLPTRVRVRIYLVKAVCIFSKGTGFADPFIDFALGREIRVSMRNMAKRQTNTPEFYRVEERDVELPDDSRLEVRIMDLQDMALSDNLIGATVIDLEDRWHSSKWQWKNQRQLVPVENRSLFTSEAPGTNRGSMEMWVEMIESVKASDLKPSDLRRPPDTNIEIRMVIWTAANVPIVTGDYVHVKIVAQLDCKEYGASQFYYPLEQPTDVHFTSKDGKAIFNWRIVYPDIRMPTASCCMNLKLYHYELLGDTFIGSMSLDLKKYCERVSKDSDALTIGPADLQFQPLEAGAEELDCGSVNATLYVLTSAEATNRMAGVGRGEPNENPMMITPTEGRDWGSYLAGFGIGFPDFGLWKKLIPLFVAMVMFLASVIAMKQMGLL